MSRSKWPSSNMYYLILLFIVVVIAPLWDSVKMILSIATIYHHHLDASSCLQYLDNNEYSNLQDKHDIDPSIESRAQSSTNQQCSWIFLYLPDDLASHGHSSQMNTYIVSILLATYYNRALVLLEPPLKKHNKNYLGGSQFGYVIGFTTLSWSGNNNEDIIVIVTNTTWQFSIRIILIDTTSDMAIMRMQCAMCQNESI